MAVFDPSRAGEDLVRMAADFERQAGRFEQLRGRVAALAVTETSRDRRIGVTVDSNGVTTDITLAASTRGMDPAAITAEIMSCLHRALARLRTQVTEAVHEVVGDDPAGTAITDQYARRFPDVAAADTQTPNYIPPAYPPSQPVPPQPPASAAPWEMSVAPPRGRKPDRDQVVTPAEPDEDDEYYNRKTWLV
ncbi:YbaB/EbfC family nucleoid-associated protein [Nocardia bhagyanarayanae]|uniref:YbaB/EbfC DNA-binding family protein n=1 Tax=Nocardia bhagyanarayanae TaxID=1215925 RepID=A0A543EWL0_9NOCA|nr:YbaB/EbfC family nucleoid-associated protein [Nocardia bhagyanarayanae]TQM25879.1 hypothetical protein FB390_6047 [Nocardia bhagyanarayanae]